ncbi:MAG TPA: PDZ domain-containing protein [Sphingobacteriaceae bacterium]
MFSLAALAQTSTIKYSVSFPNAVHHEANIALNISKAPAGPLRVRVSRSSPGRYATHEFGKNIYDVHAFDKTGKMIEINQVMGDVYEIPKHNGDLKITYTVFGNWTDGTYLGIDETHAHMNMPATFMWVKGLEHQPIEITFNDLNKYGWKIATQLKPGSDQNVFTAPNLQYFMDSPVELSACKQVSWTDENPGGLKQTIKFSVHSDDSQLVVDNYGKMAQGTVAEAKAVFGELPRFDYGSYIFLNDVHPENGGDGMEHRNSTVIVERTPKVEGFENDLLSTISHEFFHAWNVERIRPRSLEPFNFEQANMSEALWFAEGFTQYYGELILKRAGYRTLTDYCNTLTRLVNSVLNSPGAKSYSAIRMSRHAVFTDAGISVDQNNNVNSITSYYQYGAIIALALDLRLRSEFNLTLDDYMRAVWKAHGKTEKPYTLPDLQKILSTLTNNTFAGKFFQQYIYGTEKNNYEKLLSYAGLVLRKAAPGKASLGVLRLLPANGNVRVAANTIKGSPAYQAGLDNGDYLKKINEDELKSPDDLTTLLTKYKPGEEVTLTFVHRGIVKNSKIVLQEDTLLEVIPSEVAGTKINSEMQSFRDKWLSSRVQE